MRVSVVLRRTVVGSGDWRFENLSGSHHQSQVNSCGQSNVLIPVRIIASTATPPTSERLAETSQKDWLNTSEGRGKVLSTITLLSITDLYWLGLCLAYSTNYFQPLPLESWFTNLEQTPLNSCQPLLATIQTTHSRHKHYKRTEQNDLTLTTEWDRPVTTDLRHLSLITDNIAAKQTNQFMGTGLRRFDWQQLFTWLWWWLKFRLSNVSQSQDYTHPDDQPTLLHVTHGFKPFTEFCLRNKQNAAGQKRLSPWMFSLTFLETWRELQNKMHRLFTCTLFHVRLTHAH